MHLSLFLLQKCRIYQSCLVGIFNICQSDTMNLDAFSTSELTGKVKTKALDLVIKQSKNFIS
ncbi:DUF2501 domain-containing protein [Sodalis-like endosymbiont of Proechinophthirus fluctus]|uniref:DUF2501 domain-containing protein n=1 Tax=Sodalis-like endosymbiont of Proechinophthirus fluctus TaxID=1462730 RepID=UPI000AAB0AD2